MMDQQPYIPVFIVYLLTAPAHAWKQYSMQSRMLDLYRLDIEQAQEKETL